MKRITSVTCATLLIFFLTMDAWANDAEELARKAQDPLANISAVQLDMSSKFNVGPDNDTAYSALVQPVYAISTEKINYIPRAVIPVIGAPNTTSGNSDVTWGVGDIVGQIFISPKTEGNWKWGVGPQISFDTHTDDALAGPGWGGGIGCHIAAPSIAGNIITRNQNNTIIITNIKNIQ